MSADAPRLELREVSKSFGGTRALDRVSLSVRGGEVHVVAGENGAGKSTLIRVMAGALLDFEGALLVDGRAQRFASPAAARAAGIATIHQELSLVPGLTVADNLELSRGGRPFAPFVRRAAEERARVALDRVGLALDPRLPVEALSLAERQEVEIARALAGEVRVLVMDEPTSALPEPDARRLLDLVERLRSEGLGIVYISHRMDEIYRLADRITVLRDGRHVLTRRREELGRAELVDAMLGQAPRAARRAAPGVHGSARLVARALRGPGARGFGPLDLALARGEIVGLAGVEGSGGSELLHALFGDPPAARGEVTLDGEPYAPAHPRAALARGVALLAARREQSVLAELDVVENATLSSLAAYSPRGLLSPRRELRATEPATERVKLKAPSLAARAVTLSGGNQQKVALARCLLTRPRLLLLDDPTRGIDLGARADVHELLRALAQGGTTVLFRSSDLGELETLAERVLVLVDGAVTATLAAGELDLGRLLGLMMGGAA
jgi:ribose transport system ATP-binding protein